ncbi:tRNA preQ1(34) S-adenosylmethionine ribosyltransferase-isomerase QueA [Myxococcota bacterium]|nr:tRNA preQ1(34) S-adenosylmethionine ribosyltransferase-isomerase QueA [Myxococcota bacterium]MBU1429141.1 tRNA preQ1(34) S-adenosylmethionine ribosyltransferase-isomerase QueA [Myxococcota bacterium]MBU1897009.1 tRNA preQ1(34) S-adenosylmethionine ribosyltransferase-isomerase QueA [Myxococcota bacterium]
MRRQDFHFDLPPELIAQRPAARRDESRLLRLLPGLPPTITPFHTILDLFRGDEVLVLNDTKVVPARVRGHKESGGQVEVFIIEPLGPGRVAALLRGRNLKPGARLALPGGVTAALGPRREDETSTLELPVEDLWGWLEAYGEVPLPPYIERQADEADLERYQTVFARHPGAVAAPTAGLHFTPALLDALRAKGVAITTLTLHVGPGTFRPVRADRLDDHVMHAERFRIPQATWALIRSGRPVIAVGTTVVRALEAAARGAEAQIADQFEYTEIFIRPGFEFRIVDGLLTNFHLPESTLLMLVAALSSRARVLDAYQQAVAARMRFYSYGDAMILSREDGRWI